MPDKPNTPADDLILHAVPEQAGPEDHNDVSPQDAPASMTPDEAAAWARGFEEGVARATVPVALDFEEIEKIALRLQANGPDEFPMGYYRAEAQRIYRERRAGENAPPKPVVTEIVDEQAIAKAREEGRAEGRADHDHRDCVAAYVEKILDAQRNLLNAAYDDPDLAETAQEHANGMGIALTIIQTAEIE